MGALIIGYGMSVLVIAVSSRSVDRLRQIVDEADAYDLTSMRARATSNENDYALGAFVLLTAAGAASLIARDRALGWAMLGVPLMLGVGIASTRRSRRRMLVALQGRGVVERSDRYVERHRLAQRLGTAALLGYTGANLVEIIYPPSRPWGADVARGLLMILFLVGVLGYVAVRVRIYLQGDDLE